MTLPLVNVLEALKVAESWIRIGYQPKGWDINRIQSIIGIMEKELFISKPKIIPKHLQGIIK
jgi:hypothetical protein